MFFAGGSVTDPAKRYHLELATSHLQVSRELEVLLRECGYPPKSVARNGSFITYFKQSDQIEDFLTLIGAPVAAMADESRKLYGVQWHPERLFDKEKSEAVNGSLLLDAFLHHYKFV